MNVIPVLINLTDPWELGEALGWKSFKGKIIRIDSDKERWRALIELEYEMNHSGLSFRFLVASPRHGEDRIEYMTHQKRVTCAFIWIQDVAEGVVDMHNTENWSGVVAFIRVMVLGEI